MNLGYHIAAVALYFIAILILPWWGVMVYAIILIAYVRAWVSVIIGAFIFDALYGSSTGPFSIFSIPYLYTLILVAVATSAHFLRTRLLE